MNEEEKKAIEILKWFKDNKIQRDKLEIDNRCGGWKIGRIYKFLELNTAIETVLNLLEKKNEEIENYKTLLAQSTVKRVITSLKDSEKSKEDLKLLNDGWRIECEKKDKIIDEIQKEVRDHIGFENRLKRDNKEPDLFNQGRFYVANNINNIMKRK